MMELVVISALKADGVYPREGSSPSSRINLIVVGLEASILNECGNRHSHILITLSHRIRNALNLHRPLMFTWHQDYQLNVNLANECIGGSGYTSN